MSLVETDTIFGRIVTGGDIEDWTLACLQRWSCTYLSELERQHGLPPASLPDVRSWVQAFTFDKWPEDQLPAVFVINSGTAERPQKHGDGSYYVRWTMRIGVLTSANTQEAAHKLAHLYLAAHSMILIQRPSLDEMAEGTDWLAEGDMPLVYDDTRTLAGRVGTFTVATDKCRFANAGPATPGEPLEPCHDPWLPWPHARLVDIEIDNVGLLEPMPNERSE